MKGYPIIATIKGVLFRKPVDEGSAKRKLSYFEKRGKEHA